MSQPSFGARIGLAFSAFFKILFDGAFAGRVQDAAAGRTPAMAPPAEEPAATPVADAKPVAAVEPAAAEQSDRSALQLLGALQREGRLVDFLMESIDGAGDADLGAAARVVHGGCQKVIASYFTVEPVWPGEEGSAVTVDEGFDPMRIQLTGNVTGEPPFEGVLQHPGWRVERVELPVLGKGQDVAVLAPAEVEL